MRGSGAAISNRQVPGGSLTWPLRPAAVRCKEELAADVGGAERGRSQMTAESCFIQVGAGRWLAVEMQAMWSVKCEQCGASAPIEEGKNTATEYTRQVI